MQKVRANMRFKDKTKNENWRELGEIWEVDEERAWVLTQSKYNNTYYCDYAGLPWKEEGTRILIYNYDLYKIGGTETFLLNFCKYFKDKNIIILYHSGRTECLNELHKYTILCRDNGKDTYDCDVLILGNYFASNINDRVRAKERYQMIHADYTGMREAGWNITYKKPENVKPICVSDVAAQGLKREYGYDSIVNYNILDKDLANERPMVFITLSRATKEKGIERIIALSQLFKKHNKKFLWLLCGTVAEQSANSVLREIRRIPEIVLVPPSSNNKALIGAADYLVQLSDTESFCYSAYEALIMGKPVIVTDFPESVNIVKQGKNGYIIPRDVKKYNKKLVDKIFNKIPTEIGYVDRCDYDLWERILSGEEVPYGNNSGQNELLEDNEGTNKEGN